MKNQVQLFILLMLLSVSSRASVPRVFVQETVIEQTMISPGAATALIRLEIEKTKLYTTVDKTEISDDSLGLKSSCLSTDCLIAIGKNTKSDKVLQSSIIKFGNKIAITVKLMDVQSGVIEKIEVTEFIDLEDQIQFMVQIALNNLFGLENDKNLTEKLVYFQNISDIPVAKVNNNGPRMGLAYVSGDAAKRLTADKNQGGYDMSPVFSQFGYQLEAQYLSAGNLQALAEFLFMFSGLDQQMCIPSIAILNGFRLNNSGFEIAFGPNIRIQKKAWGFYDENDNWILSKTIPTTYDNNGAVIPIEGEQLLIDRRGNPYLTSGWIWAFGKTFRSGYLNVPVNIYVSKSKSDWYSGISVGFNIRNKSSK